MGGDKKDSFFMNDRASASEDEDDSSGSEPEEVGRVRGGGGEDEGDAPVGSKRGREKDSAGPSGKKCCVAQNGIVLMRSRTHASRICERLIAERVWTFSNVSVSGFAVCDRMYLNRTCTRCRNRTFCSLIATSRVDQCASMRTVVPLASARTFKRRR
jgi:hypothetical protein